MANNLYYSNDFKEKCFVEWYNEGKPPITAFSFTVGEDEYGRKPSKQILFTWSEEWRKRAELLDEEVKKQLEARLIAEKVEMLKRHAIVGKKMQNLAVEYLDQPDMIKKLSPNSAIRLLVEGLKVERISVGMPDVLEEVMTKTDEELLEDITKLITDGSSEFMIDKDE